MAGATGFSGYWVFHAFHPGMSCSAKKDGVELSQLDVGAKKRNPEDAINIKRTVHFRKRKSRRKCSNGV